MVVASALWPVYVAIFIILFDIYWFLRVFLLSLYLMHTYRQMKENMQTDWLEKTKKIKGWDEIYNLIILPMVDEPYAVVKETFEELKNTHYPKDKFIVVLAQEERASGENAETGRRIEEEYGHLFHKFIITVHPHNLPNETIGKGSNQAWAARHVRQDFIDKEGLSHEKIILSVFDVDTQIYPEYFGLLVYRFLTVEDPQMASYQPIPLFNNNIYQAPAFARVIALSATYYQMMQSARPENMVTFSSHSMPFKALAEIGYWHTDKVSEDSRIFWQCFVHYHGNWRVVPLIYPVSMDANAAPGFWQTVMNVYRQQRRWAWGSENLSYMVTSFIKDKKMKLFKKIYWTLYTTEASYSWAMASVLIFALGWLPLFLGGQEFNTTLLSYNLPRVTTQIMSWASLGIAISAILGVLLLPPKPKWFRPRHYFLYLAQWILLPVTMILLGSLPAIDAQTRLMLGGQYRLDKFWVTPKTREFKKK
ncbi:MAG: glycosyltransferase family 2 protein [Candidatus Colwellbacteria bacterium]|nr:glycosyltransferase family 2 protein [Candidatus Colwellbacteria bacterium]